MKVDYTMILEETTREEIKRVVEVKSCYECPYFRRSREKDLYHDPFYDIYNYYCGKKRDLFLGRLSFGAAANEEKKEKEAFGRISKKCPFE